MQRVGVTRARNNHKHDLTRLDERNRSVLELASSEALSVDVGQLLELKRALKCNWVTNVATEEEHGLGVRHPMRQLLDRLRGHENLRDLVGHSLKLRDVLANGLVGESAPHTSDVQSNQVERGYLSDKSLCGCHSNLRTSVSVDNSVRLARNRRSVRVAHGNNLRAGLHREPDRHKRVHRLTRLANRDDERTFSQNRVTVTELVSELNVNRYTSPRLNGVLAEHASVCGCSTGNNDDAIDVGDDLIAERLEFSELDQTVLNATKNGVGYGIRLLADFLSHEARPTTLFRCRGIPSDVELLNLNGIAVEVDNVNRVRTDRHDLVLTDSNGATREFNESGDVGAEEVLSVAQADDEGRIAASADNHAGLILVHGKQSEGTHKTCNDSAQCLSEVSALLVFAPDKECRHLGVSLASEGRALGQQFVLKLGEVLDDSVVDQCELRVAPQMRVRVHIGGATVSRPPSVPDTSCSVAER